MKGHLNRQEIQHFIDRKVDPSALLQIDEHLASCEICGQEMAELLENQSSVAAYSALDLNVEGGEEHPAYELLADYVDGAADEVEFEIVEVHTSACQSCSTQIAELRLLRAEINRSDTRQQQPSIWSSWWRILVPAAAIVVLGIFALLFFVPGETKLETAGVTVLIEELPTPDLDEPSNTNGSNVDQPVLADAINDGGRTIGLDENGQLVGLDFSREFNDKLTRAFKSGIIDVPNAAKGLDAQRGVLMGDGDGVAFSLRSPVGRAIEPDRPTFRWEQFKDAESYEVSVFDDNFNNVASSGKITSTTWTSTPLPRGKVYQWQVTATKGGVETRSPVRPAPDARFLLISGDAAAAIRQARSVRPRSNLLLGIAYAEAGMIEEARAEFRALVRRNPKSVTARRLLRSVR